MKKKNHLIIILMFLIASIIVVGAVYACRQSNVGLVNDEGKNLIGGQKDDHGCLIAAGYSWCEVKDKCLRVWEEDCELEMELELEPAESDVSAIKQAFMEKYEKNEREVQVTIEKFNGNYARGGVKFGALGEAAEGGIFLAYKEGEIWKLAFDGNGMIGCSTMSQYDFPENMILGCVDEDTGDVNPNTQISNPASVNCVQKGGELEIRLAEEGGQYGVCKFSDGSECEEWALFRGECE